MVDKHNMILVDTSMGSWMLPSKGRGPLPPAMSQLLHAVVPQAAQSPNQLLPPPLFYQHLVTPLGNVDPLASPGSPWGGVSHVLRPHTTLDCNQKCRALPDCKFGRKCYHRHEEDELGAVLMDVTEVSMCHRCTAAVARSHVSSLIRACTRRSQMHNAMLQDCTKIFVGGLRGTSITHNDLKNYFSQYGVIRAVGEIHMCVAAAAFARPCTPVTNTGGQVIWPLPAHALAHALTAEFVVDSEGFSKGFAFVHFK